MRGSSHCPATARAARSLFLCPPCERRHMSLLWIILIVVLVLALLGFFGRSYW
jgi:hypothetical protein